MKNLIAFFIISVTIVSCSLKEKPKTVEPSFDLYGTSELVLLNKSTDSARVEISNYPIIIGGVQVFDTVLFAGDSVNFTLKTQGYSYITFTVNDVYHKFFTSPKSVIIAKIQSDSVVNYTGAFDSINNYIAKSSGSYYSTHTINAELINLTRNPTLNYAQLVSKNDEIVRKHRLIIARHKAELPMWYLELENKRLMVQGANSKLRALMYRKRMLDFDDEMPPHYVDSIVKKVPFQDERLMGFLAYSMFVQEYSNQSFNPLNDTSTYSLKEKYHDSLYAHSIHFIPQPFGDYTLAISLSQRLRLWPDGFKPEWIELLSDTVYKSFLRKRLNGGGALPKGSKAPSFTVLDIDSNQFRFFGIKDTVVLINFWSSYCSPCIENFPRENELVELFKDKPVKIINLCIESEFWRFQMLVASNKLKTVNLYANKKVSSQLNEKFDISGIPHSTLIDKNGLVVKNKCSVRGEEIVNEIEALLK